MRPSFLLHLPERLIREIEEGRAAVVGGAVRAYCERKAPRDIDVFVFDKTNYVGLAAAVGAALKPETHGAVFALSGEVPIEIVHLPGWSSALACGARADFDIAAGVYSGGRFFLPAGYEEAIKNKKMRFLGKTENPQHSYARFLKYNREYGYRIDASIHALLRLWGARSAGSEK